MSDHRRLYVGVAQRKIARGNRMKYSSVTALESKNKSKGFQILMPLIESAVISGAVGIVQAAEPAVRSERCAHRIRVAPCCLTLVTPA